MILERTAARLSPRLITEPLVGLHPIDLDEANAYLLHWGHKLGPVERPFRSEAFGLELDGRLVSVAVSASTVSDTVVGTVDGERIEYSRMQVVELARLAASEPWANRVMIRLWREVCAPRWQLRPGHALDGYHILFEVEEGGWAVTRLPSAPRDPALLKHIGGDLYAVLAIWDLTPLERTVIAGTRVGRA